MNGQCLVTVENGYLLSREYGTQYACHIVGVREDILINFSGDLDVVRSSSFKMICLFCSELKNSIIGNNKKKQQLLTSGIVPQ